MNLETLLVILVFSNIATLIYFSFVIAKISTQMSHFCQTMGDLTLAIKSQTNLLERMEWRS